MDHFWLWSALEDDPDGERELALEGVIDSELWFGDEVTPRMFREELNKGSGPIVVRINSPGGDCAAAAQIYGMLMEYPGHVVIKIDSLAASAASVVAMAGDEVRMNPVGLMMIHNPSTVAWGNRNALISALDGLNECQESLINAYKIKTNLPRERLRAMMDAETWMNSGKALELGFIDSVMYGDGREKEKKKPCSDHAGTQRMAARATGYMVSMRDVRAMCLENAIKRASTATLDAASLPDQDTSNTATPTERDRASLALAIAQARAALHA
ncbi:MAG: Clp protease ClpP [Clostridia bacterium]